jgi:3-hydroxyisobutyrate dehydrogenase-like beta-hydroxyacid dehydrogenase
MKVGFIGLGRMGTAMANRILGAGHDLAVYNRTAGKSGELIGKGAKHAASTADAARYGDVVVTMLEHDGALAHIAHGVGGLIASMAKGTIHLAMGTHGLALIKALTEAHAKAGQILVSAPVLGRPPVAATGQLGIITGGPTEAVEKCRPLFEAMGRRTFDGGTEPAGAAAAKIANNFVLACAIEAMSEAFALAEKSGVAPASFLEVLTDGLFAAPAYKTYGKLIVEQGYLGEAGFAATTGLKDVTLALAAGEGLGVPLPSANVCRDRLISALAHGNGHRDWSIMALEQKRASGMA